ncbi:MAG TPA: M17 family peptidase N-terminal domain-containing protein [Myxococcota bacterium]|nr:M17 family peptidase N-terminal domain-containing protein [Myxococcota bacterium]HOC98632.1 M17 family peptidase N-terminal domain-containing protein [Myxococcota bacterium]HOH75897.1 M17 family peptidase N-terminal domain-containing protein [Myxococcota bacterium]
MKVSLVKPDLHAIDQLDIDTVAIPVFEDMRPPAGLTGLIDWRLCGRVSALLVSGQLSGRFREAAMMPGYGRLPGTRIVAFGMGDSREFSQSRAREAAWFMSDSLRRLKTGAFLTALPGSMSKTVPPRAGLEMMIEEIGRVFSADESFQSLDVSIVEAQESHRELNDLVSSAMRRLRGVWK